MKYIVTPKNIKSIAKMIEKISKNKSLVSQTFYPTSKKVDVIYKNIGIDKHIITKSMVSVFDEVVIELDCMFDKHFIRVHNNDRDTDDFNYSNFRAFIIDCGDVVEFKNNTIYLRSTHPTKRTEKANEVIKFV